MLLGLWTNFYEDWELQHTVTFDGANRLVIISKAAATIDFKEEIYSAWKEWTRVRDHAKFLPAIRNTGGDPVGGGEYTGDVYFMINGWRILIGHSCAITGVVYSDDYPTPFVQVEGTQIVTNTVSSLVNAISTGGAGASAVEMRQEMDANSTKLAQIKALIDSMIIPTLVTIESKQADALTKNEFIALQ